MKQKDLFKLALGLEDPWMVREVRFDLEEGKLDIWLDFPRGHLLLPRQRGRRQESLRHSG